MFPDQVKVLRGIGIVLLAYFAVDHVCTLIEVLMGAMPSSRGWSHFCFDAGAYLFYDNLYRRSNHPLLMHPIVKMTKWFWLAGMGFGFGAWVVEISRTRIFPVDAGNLAVYTIQFLAGYFVNRYNWSISSGDDNDDDDGEKQLVSDWFRVLNQKFQRVMEGAR